MALAEHFDPLVLIGFVARHLAPVHEQVERVNAGEAGREPATEGASPASSRALDSISNAKVVIER